MEINLLFAKIAWVLLIVVMVMRPLRDVWNDNLLCKRLNRYRKHLGIAAGLAAITHV